jgi:hypothetical protein
VRLCEGGDVESKTGYHKLEFALGDLLLVQWSVRVASLALQFVETSFYVHHQPVFQTVGARESDHLHCIAPIHLLVPRSCARVNKAGPKLRSIVESWRA